ncbi:MAG: hypothetical protein NTX01_05505 [Candidatus Omnitrophica bacterium]|nr:hypothetical protein [Candidatus Omnitrophota bacterium]
MSDLSEHTLTSSDFESLFGEKLSLYVQGRIKKYDLRYSDVTTQERDSYLKKIVSILLGENLMYSGEHRHEQWDKGWRQNLDELLKSNASEAMIPRYFGKYQINRLKQKFIRPVSKNFEYNMLGVILDWLFDKYLRDYKNIYEFGCGTGHNLTRLRSFNSKANLWGLDWAESSQAMINKYALINSDKKLFAHKFDYFAPDFNLELKKDSAIYTVASLEQVGVKYHLFVDYLLKKKPNICIHVEPIEELLHAENLMDYLSICYFKKRKYLSGYLTYLKGLESKRKIKIIKAQRSYIGSFFIEGYSIIVWIPLV